MSAPLFAFIQADLPTQLAPPEGSWSLREQPGGQPTRIVLIAAAGARSADVADGRRGRRGPWRAQRQRPRPQQPEDETVALTVTRATVIDPTPRPNAAQAQAWLSTIDPRLEIPAAFACLNRLMSAHRIAAADPYAHELSPAQAVAVRAGFGEGAELAAGRWLQAREIGPHTRRATRLARRRAATGEARRQNRFVALLGLRSRALICEELALRARADLDQRRPAHAAIELERAYAAAARELPELLSPRLHELSELRPRVAEMAAQALAGDQPPHDEIAHALGRLEAALRALALLRPAEEAETSS